MPPLPPASSVKKTETSKHTEMYCRKFRKPCNEDRRHEESPFFDCWDWKQEQTDFLQQVDPGARNAPVCQKLGVHRHLPNKAQPYFLLPNKRAGGKKSDRRRVWHFMDRERRPRKRRDPKGRSVWDFTYNHEAAGSDVWLKPGFSSSSAQPSRPFTPLRSRSRAPKKRAFRSACSEEGSRTSPVKEKVDLTKFQLNLLRVTTPMMESSGLTRWTGIQSQQVTSLSTVDLLKQMASEVDTEKSQLTPVQENHL